MSDLYRDNLIRVKEEIDSICQKMGRSSAPVIVAVSKNRTPEEVKKLLDLGIKDFGENRVQEFLDKVPYLPDFIRWHFVGHLQRNKVKYLLRLPGLKLIHSVDSLRLARKISQEGKKQDRVISVLLQVNLAGEESKFGFSENQLYRIIPELKELPYIEYQGLMTMTPLVEDAEAVRPVFQRLRQLRDMMAEDKGENFPMRELSMGMTQDYLVAVEEGATIIRLGRAVFPD